MAISYMGTLPNFIMIRLEFLELKDVFTLMKPKKSLCTIKIDDLRTYYMTPAYSTIVVLV